MMTREEAIEKLGVTPNASPEEIRRRFQEVYSDLQLRLANAPTPRLRETYQKNIQEVRSAFAILSSAGEYTEAKDLPTAEPVINNKESVIPKPLQDTDSKPPLVEKKTKKIWPWVVSALAASIVITAVLLFAIWRKEVVTFKKTYGGPDWETAITLQQTDDGGYYIIGRVGFDVSDRESAYLMRSHPSGRKREDLYLLKVDSQGNIVWERSFPGKFMKFVIDAKPTNDGGYIVLGETQSYGDLVVLRIDSQGNRQWEKTYKQILNSNIQETTISQHPFDGSFFIKLQGYSNGGNFLLKIDSLGTKQWAKSMTVDLYNLQLTNDGGYIVHTATKTSQPNEYQVALLKFDSSGNKQWTKAFSPISRYAGSLMRMTKDRGYIVAGYEGSSNQWCTSTRLYLLEADSNGNKKFEVIHDFNYRFCDIVDLQTTFDGGCIVLIAMPWDNYPHLSSLIKIDSSGKIEWTKKDSLDFTGELYSIKAINKDGYMIASCWGAVGVTEYSPLTITRIDVTGNTIWRKAYNLGYIEAQEMLQSTNDGGFIILGNIEKSDDFALIKTDSHCNVIEKQEIKKTP